MIHQTGHTCASQINCTRNSAAITSIHVIVAIGSASVFVFSDLDLPADRAHIKTPTVDAKPFPAPDHNAIAIYYSCIVSVVTSGVMIVSAC